MSTNTPSSDAPSLASDGLSASPDSPTIPAAALGTMGAAPISPSPSNAATGGPPRSLLTPLLAIMAFSFINSIGCGTVTTGIFFLTESPRAYQFSTIENLWLGVGIGIAYILGAKGAGPALRALRRPLHGMTSRRYLIGVVTLMALLCALPPILQIAGVPARSPLGIAGLFVLAFSYNPLAGALWPMVESYLSGGRRAAVLRSAMGRWNATWATALVLSYWGMSPFVKEMPIYAFAALTFVHLGAVVVLIWFTSEPAPHATESHEANPASYAPLLTIHRYMLPMSYVATSVLSPILPTLLKNLNVGETWRPVLASAWLVPRAAGFYVLHRWQGWQGRWASPAAAGVLLCTGFAGAVLFPSLGDTPATIPLFLASLVLFGLGMALLYFGAIYYAMEVGNAEVDAGGTHEALIGVGYTLGPLCGLAGAGLAVAGAIPSGLQNASVVGFVGVLSCLALGTARRAVRRASGR